MKIILHGNVIKFVCPTCGCVFLKSETECHVEHLFADDKEVAQQYWSECPDCFEDDLEGVRLKAHMDK